MRWIWLACCVLVSAIAHASDDPADLGIHRLAERIERAVRAADSGAYMALVDPRDPVFAQEQRNWARDLRVRPVASFSFGIDDVRPVRSHAGTHVARVTVRWVLPDEGASREVVFDAAFRPMGLPEGAWLFAGRVWDVREARGVRLLTIPGDDAASGMADYLADHTAELRAGVEAALRTELPTDPTIKIYPDLQSLQASIALSYTDPLGGWNEPGESIKLLARRGLAGPSLDAVVAHELGHAVSFEWGDAITDAPWWALEGIAEVAADPFRPERFRMATDQAISLMESGRLIPLDLLADFRGEAMNHMQQVYVQGRSIVRYIADRFGEDQRLAWFQAMGAGLDIDRATRSALGIAFETLEADWRGSLER